MAYRRYAEAASDIFIDSTGRPRGGFTATVWTARTGGTQIVDLLDENGVAINVVTSDNDGTFPFQANTTQPSTLWLAFTGAEKRYAVTAADVGTRVDAIEAAGGGFSGVPNDGSVTNVKVNAAAAIATSKIAGLDAALTAKAADSAVVHLSGTETVTGNKTFSGTTTVSTPSAGGHAVTKTYADALVATLNSLLVLNGHKVTLAPLSSPPAAPSVGDVWGQVVTS